MPKDRICTIRPIFCRTGSFFRKAVSVIIAATFFISSLSYAADDHISVQKNNLAPELRVKSGDFKELFRAAAICRLIEKEGQMGGDPSLSDIASLLDTVKKDYRNVHVIFSSDDILIEIPEEGVAVRYFNFTPEKPNFITPYTDVSKLVSKEIGPHLWRQIIRRTKALPGPQTKDSILPVPEKVNETRSLFRGASGVIRSEKRPPRVLLVQTNVAGLNNLMPPLGLYYLRASLRRFAGADVEIIDLGMKTTDQEEIDRILSEKVKQFRPDIVGLSFTTTSSLNAYKAARVIRDAKPDAVIAGGGAHINAVPYWEIFRRAPFDCLVRGEGEIAFSKLVSVIAEDGSYEKLSAIKGVDLRYDDLYITNGPAEVIQQLDDLPYAHMAPEELSNYNIWIVDKDRPAVPIMTSRGCPFGCTFCSKGVFGKRTRERSLDNVMHEIRYYYDKGYRNFTFIDDAFGANVKRVSRFCDMLIETGLNRDISWRATIRTDQADYALLQKMKRAGCVGLAFGIESGSQRILDKVVHKGTKVENNLRTIKLAKKAGIEEVRLFIMVGLPDETEADVRKTIEFVKESDPTSIGLSIAVPYPGSPWGNEPRKFRTSIIGGYDHFMPYVKAGTTGKYTDGVPLIIHETSSLSRDDIAGLYTLMRAELADYMYDEDLTRTKFIVNKFAGAAEALEETGLIERFPELGVMARSGDLAKACAPYIRKIKDSGYLAWRSMDRQYDEIWKNAGADNPDSIADKGIMAMVLLHSLAPALGVNIDQALTYFLSPVQLETERGPPLLPQFNKLAIAVQAAGLLRAKQISRDRYDALLESFEAAVTEPSLKRVLSALRDIGYSMPADKVTSAIRRGEADRLVEGEDLILTPVVQPPSSRVTGNASLSSDPGELNEIVALLKPPTTARSDGSLNLEFIKGVLDRLDGNFDYEVSGIRILSGDYFSRHEDLLSTFYHEAFTGYTKGIVSESVMRAVETIYGQADFERFLGHRFDRSMVIPARDLIAKYGFTEEELDALWSPSRFPISVTDLEKRYGVKVRIVEDGAPAPQLAEGEVAIPRSLTIRADGVTKVDWFEKRLPWGVNKVAQGVNVLPVKDARINGGKPVVIVNGYVPTLFANFKKPGSNKTIAFLLRQNKRNDGSLHKLRVQFLGDENMPDRNPKGTVRRDAFDGLFPIPEELRLGLRGSSNGMHISTSVLEGMKETMAIFGRPIRSTRFGQALIREGYPDDQIHFLLSNPNVRRLVDGRYEEASLFALVNKMDEAKALETIRGYFPPYQVRNPERTPSLSFSRHLDLVRGASLVGNRLSGAQLRRSSVEPTRIEDLSAREREDNRLKGEELLRAGKVAVVIGAGGEGGRKIGYDVSDATLRDKVHNTLLNIRVLGKDISANLAEVRAAHIRGTQDGNRRNIPVMVMGNDKNIAHIVQVWEAADLYGLDSMDVTFYSQNGVYRFNPSREDVLKAKSVIAELKKNHDLRIQHGLIPAGTPFNLHRAIDDLLVRNGDTGNIFRTNDGSVSTKPCGHMDMLLQPFLNGRLAALAERGTEILVAPNGDDMGFNLDPVKIGHFARSGKQMMATLVRMQPGEQGGILADADMRGDGVFRTQIVEKDNLPEDFNYSDFRNFNANQNYFNVAGVLRFFLGAQTTEENLRLYYAMTQEERLELASKRLAGIKFNYAIKPVKVGDDIAPDGTAIPRMSAAGQFERIVGAMSQVLDTAYILIDRKDYGAIKTGDDERSAERMIEENISRGVPYRFRGADAVLSGETVSAYVDKNVKVVKDILARENSPVLLRIPVEAVESIGSENIRDFLSALQSSPDVYIELFQMSGIGSADTLYSRYGIEKRRFPRHFSRENTITLFPVLRGEDVDREKVAMRIGSVDMTPKDTILAPIGLQSDQAGLIRATILGIKMMDVARKVRERGAGILNDANFKSEIQLGILEDLKTMYTVENLRDVGPDDIIALATSSNITKIVTALNKLIKLLPIRPIDANELREIYKHVKEVLSAA